jgi:exodeoxyribonuclease-3
MENETTHLVSWNVNGIRAIERKGFLDWLEKTKTDVVCLQETKAHPDQLSPALLRPAGCEAYWNSAEKKGYSGTCVYARVSPVMAVANFGDRLLDEEGRIVMLEFGRFYLFNVYFPNGGRGEHRVEYKLRFCDRLLDLLQSFRKKKPIVLCGDLNTAHKEIDLAHPKENSNLSGFLPQERAWIDKLVAHGYLDTFRIFHDEGERYTWWAMTTRARQRNVGWRIDYFFVSEELRTNILGADIHEDVMGSDHCPVSLKLEF